MCEMAVEMALAGRVFRSVWLAGARVSVRIFCLADYSG
jgi:hypothetical protein